MNKVLVIAPTWVGDMVMSQVLFKFLRQHNPEIIIDVLARRWSFSLLERMPEVNKAISSPFLEGKLQLGERYRLGQSLRSQGYDQAIILPNSLKAALMPFWANIPVRTGWRGEMRYGLLNDLRLLDKSRLPLMIQRFTALALPKHEKLPDQLPFPELQISQKHVLETLQKYQLNTKKPILALCPGSGFGPTKRWPVHYYTEVARKKIDEGYDVWLFGSAHDRVLSQEIQQQLDHGCVDLTGETTLTEAVDLLSLAKIVVSNDSGLMHVAAALKRYVIVMYGSTSSNFTPPLSKNAKILCLHLPCSPCFKRECALKHFKCMMDLKPKLVLDAIEEFE